MDYRRLVEKYIGRRLKSSEVVHHLDIDRDNNELENFFVFEKREYHDAFHRLVRSGYLEKTALNSNLDLLKHELQYNTGKDKFDKIDPKKLKKIKDYIRNIPDKYPWTPTEEQANEFLKISEEIENENIYEMSNL